MRDAMEFFEDHEGERARQWTERAIDAVRAPLIEVHILPRGFVILVRNGRDPRGVGS